MTTSALPTASTYRERIQRLSELGRTKEMEAVIAFSPEAVFYLTGAAIMTQRILPERLAIVIARPAAEPVLVVCNIEEDLAKKHSLVRDIRIYVEYERSPIEVVMECLRDWGLHDAVVGVEMDFLTAKFFQQLQEASGSDRLRFEDSSDLLRTLRMTKDQAELSILERANQVTDRAIRAAFEASRIGDTER